MLLPLILNYSPELSGVMANLGCQLDHICNKLKPKQLGKLMRYLLDWIIWGEMIHPKSEYTMVANYCRIFSVQSL